LRGFEALDLANLSPLTLPQTTTCGGGSKPGNPMGLPVFGVLFDLFRPDLGLAPGIKIDPGIV